MYRPDNFTIYELAHPEIIKSIGENNTWLRLDDRCLRDLQHIRNEWFKIHGSGVYVNRLNLGIDSRGLRPPNDKDGSFYSVHKQGKAFDLEPINGKIKEFYNLIYTLISRNELKSINTLEDLTFTPSWVHVANMNVFEKPFVIKP